MAIATGGSSVGSPFSKRALDSLRSPSRNAAWSTVGPSNVAASSSTCVVAAETSTSAAPMMPAMTAGRSASQIARMPWSITRR